jgi:shikimate dehydrogenase
MKQTEEKSVATKVSISGNTRLLGLLGDPVDHSISPAMHNLAFETLGLNYAYMAFISNGDNLKSTVDAMRALNVLGFNVTMPVKQKIIPYLDKLSIEAELIGSVNTVHNENGQLVGYNTDGLGYVADLQDKGVNIEGRSFLLLGAGGAATGISVELARAGAGKITILNRNIEKARRIVFTINKISKNCQASASKLHEESIHKELPKADILINCTPVGMGDEIGNSIIKDLHLLPKGLIVSDLIYTPGKTALLELGEKAGCKTINGSGMILWQGALAFKIWTGEDMPLQTIKTSLF